MKYNLVTVIGPTACGKTKLAVKLASLFQGEIISADSRQVYKRMNIGTGKDLHEFVVNNSSVPYHLIDVVDPDEEFDVYRFVQHFKKSFAGIHGRKKVPFLVGGTGMYLSAVLQKYHLPPANFSGSRKTELLALDETVLRGKLYSLNPSLHNTTDLINKERLVNAILVAEAHGGKSEDEAEDISSFTIGIQPERKTVKEKIADRLTFRLKNGMIEEVERLVASGITFEKLHFFGLEYRYIGMYLQRQLSYNDMVQKLRSAINQFSKRQMTWFRKMEKEGVIIHWLPDADLTAAVQLIEQACPHFLKP